MHFLQRLPNHYDVRTAKITMMDFVNCQQRATDLEIQFGYLAILLYDASFTLFPF